MQVASAWSAINGALKAVFNIRMEQNVSWSSLCICFIDFSYGEKLSWQSEGVSYVRSHLIKEFYWKIKVHLYENKLSKLKGSLWRRGVVVITTAQLHSTKPELRFCTGWNPVCGVLEIRSGEDLWQWSRLEIRLNAFRRSTIPQKQLIIIIIIIITFINLDGMSL